MLEINSPADKVSNPKQPSCKKGAAPKKAIVKNDVKSKVAWPRNG